MAERALLEPMLGPAFLAAVRSVEQRPPWGCCSGCRDKAVVQSDRPSEACPAVSAAVAPEACRCSRRCRYFGALHPAPRRCCRPCSDAHRSTRGGGGTASARRHDQSRAQGSITFPLATLAACCARHAGGRGGPRGCCCAAGLGAGTGGSCSPRRACSWNGPAPAHHRAQAT